MLRYRIAILVILCAGCTAPRVTVDARPPTSAATAAWQRQMTARINAITECLSVQQRMCVDIIEQKGEER